jgi:hypothetical protein
LTENPLVRRLLPYARAALIVSAYTVSVLWVWGIYSARGPFLPWAIESLLPHGKLVFRSVVTLHDALANVLLALPYAFLFVRFVHESRWTALKVMVALKFLYEYRVLFQDAVQMEFSRLSLTLSSWFGFTGVIYSLFALPFGVWLVERVWLSMSKAREENR